jgi:membrane protein implicated in regulation of membrane protease activity
MQNIRFPIWLTTIVLFIYVASVAMGFPFPIIFALFLLGNGLLIWMVYRVLRFGQPSEKTFEEAFYEDYDGRS